MPKEISILMPVYNMENFIGQAIESALQQTYQNFELLIVDDNSTDNTPEVIKNFDDSRIKYYRNEKNLGPIANFNKCLSLSNSEFVVFLHADDLLNANMIEKSYFLLKTNGSIGYSFSACEIIDASGKVVRINKPFEKDFIFRGEDLYRKHLYGNFVLFPTAMVRRSYLKAIGGFDENLVYTSDWDLWLRIEAYSAHVAYFEEPLAKYRIHSQSGTSLLEKKGLTKIERYRLLKKHIDNHLCRKLFSESERRRILTLFRRRAVRNSFLRSRQFFLKGKPKNALNEMLSLFKDPNIKSELNVTDVFLSAFSIIGIIIE